VSDTSNPGPDPAAEDSTVNEPSDKLSKWLTKQPAGAGAGDSTADAPADSPAAASLVPGSISLAITAIGAQVGFAVLYAVLSWSLASQLHKAVIDSNNKAKNKKVLCGVNKISGCLDVDKTVHTVQLTTSIGTVLIAVVIAMLVQRIRRGVRWGRMAYIAACILGVPFGFAASPLSLLAVASAGPAVPRVVASLGAAASVVAIVMLFRPESQKFFDLRSPRPAAAQGRPGFGSLLRPRPPVERKPPPTSGLRSSAVSRGQARAAKAKTRNDAEAIARGAALARNRAKASKSRRTDA